MTLPPLILASASPRRADLLRELGVRFQVVPSRAQELHDPQLTAGELCQINADRKARSVAQQFPDALVLGADTLVYLGTTLFGKPASRRAARAMLAQLQGRPHQVVTGVCLYHRRQHRCRIFSEHTTVSFRPLTAAQMDAYLARINPLDKAGAYAIQEHGKLIVANISGSFSNVVGLPVERLRWELAEWLKGR